MSDPLGELLTDVSRQLGGVERLLQVQAEQSRQDREEIGRLREKVAALQKSEEWDGVDRREVKKRLGTGDHTFRKLQTEVELMKQREVGRDKELEGILKTLSAHRRFLAARRWSKLFWTAAIPAAVSLLAALIMKWIGG